MKRYKYFDKAKTRTLWDEICSMENLIKAHKNAKRGKGWYQEVKLIDANPNFYLNQLQDMLINKTYHTSKYETFYRDDGSKVRLIYKLPYFPDRICQWAIIQVIEPYLLKTFTTNTYSAIPKRGIHNCVMKVNKALREDRNGTQYCLKLDIRQFYPSINHMIFKQQYRKLFKDENLIWILDEIIDSIATANLDTTKEPIYDIDVNDTGIPIGNYLSQYSGNYYLSAFDHWLKEKKHIKYYFRYMDDMVILHESKEYLHQLRKEIEDYLWNYLRLRLKRNWQVFPTFIRGIDFVGYRFFGEFILLRKATCKKLKRSMKHLAYKKSHDYPINYHDFCAINAYKGWLKYCNSYNLYKKYIAPLEDWANEYYIMNLKKG